MTCIPAWEGHKSLWLSWLFILGLSIRMPQVSGAETVSVIFPLYSYTDGFLDGRTKADINFMEVLIPMIRFSLLPSGYWAYFTNYLVHLKLTSGSSCSSSVQRITRSEVLDELYCLTWFLLQKHSTISSKTKHLFEQSTSMNKQGSKCWNQWCISEISVKTMSVFILAYTF